MSKWQAEIPVLTSASHLRMPGEWITTYQSLPKRFFSLLQKVEHFLVIVFKLKSNNILTTENLENIERHDREFFF